MSGLSTAAALCVGLGAGGCAPSVCPTAPGEVAAAEFSAIGDETIVAVGQVIRYVDSPELESRGYDIGNVRPLRGELSPHGVFLRVDHEVPGIRGGQPVMLIAEPGPRTVVLPGVCVPLVPIGEDELEVGRGIGPADSMGTYAVEND